LITIPLVADDCVLIAEKRGEERCGMKRHSERTGILNSFWRDGMRGRVRKGRRQERRGSGRRVRCEDGENGSWSQAGKQT